MLNINNSNTSLHFIPDMTAMPHIQKTLERDDMNKDLDDGLSIQGSEPATASTIQMSAAQLQEALEHLIKPAVHWSVDQSITYPQFIRLLKPIFFDAAYALAWQRQFKPTVTVLRSLSGLHPADLRDLQHRSTSTFQQKDHLRRLKTTSYVSPSMQVVGAWIALAWPNTISMRGPAPSLAALLNHCRSQFKDHPRISLRMMHDELIRRGIVRRVGDRVTLVNPVGDLGVHMDRSTLHHVAGSVGDHLHAAISNLRQPSSHRFLEQSLVADDLSDESAAALHQAARMWWRRAVSRFARMAGEEKQQGRGAGFSGRRIRLGIYFFSERNLPDAVETKPAPKPTSFC